MNAPADPCRGPVRFGTDLEICRDLPADLPSAMQIRSRLLVDSKTVFITRSDLRVEPWNLPEDSSKPRVEIEITHEIYSDLGPELATIGQLH